MFETYRQRYQKELLESVVPFWERHSIDQQYGGYFSCLDRFGEAYDTRKYVWLQGRAIWTFSKLYNEVESRQEWLYAAAQGVKFVRQHAFDAKGRCYFSLMRDGRPVSFQRKPYGAVFIVAGLLEYSKATGDPTLRQEAIDLFWRIKSWIENPLLLDRPSYAGQPATSNLAEVMVMIMLLLELMAVDNDPRYPLLLADSIIAALKHREPRHNVLLEQVGMDGIFRLDSPEGRLLNPGHSIEVCWFLLQAFRKQPNPALQQQVLSILESSLEFGWDQQHGGIYYFMDIKGHPPLPLESNMKLWWVHTEALYAAILAYTTTRDSRWLAHIERLDKYVFRHFSDPTVGEWFGYLDRQGVPTNLCKGNSYKGFFHLPRFLLMSIQEMTAFDLL
jgi:N-acylglucosamine 2-epimerase